MTPPVLAEPRRNLDGLRRFVATVEPDRLCGELALDLLELASELEHLGTGLKLLVADRAAIASGWQDQGKRSPAQWLSEATGTSVSDAISTLDTSRLLPALPATCEALAGGRLSAGQARAIAAAADADPFSEADLVEAAGYLSLKGLQNEAQRVRAAALVDTAERRRELLRNRFLRFWTDGDGMVRLSGALTADAGATLMDAVRSRAYFAADDAMRAHLDPEPQAAYDADALVALASGDMRTDTFDGQRGGRTRSADVVLHVSLEALRRGLLEEGERCVIPGVGPVPLATVEHLIGDAFARLVVSDGVDVTTVCHLGRTVPSHVRTALEARDPVCVVPDCYNAVALEIDHWQVPYAQGGASELWNLARICQMHHRQKTYEGFTLRGGPGKWEWVARR